MLFRYPQGKENKEYTIPDNVTNIEIFAFSDCTSLASITIPDSVTSIGGGAFSGCTSLASMTIPNSVTSIEGWAFGNCTSLTSITIPNSVTSIGYCAFSGCTSLVSITFPSSVTSIEYGAFSDCTSLASITIPDSVTSIVASAFVNTAYYNDESNWKNGALYIGNYLIGAKDTLSGSNSIKPGTKVIADSAFSRCISLTSITIPKSVTSIGGGAFYQCDSLTSITIPDSVTSIGDFAFGYDYDEVQYTTCKIPDFTIYGYKNTAAEEYASDNGFKFINLDRIKVEEPQGANHGVIKIKIKDITVGDVTEKLLNSANTNTQTFTLTENRVTAFDKNGSVITDMSIKAEEGMTFKLEKTDGTAAVYDLKLETTLLGDVNGDGIIDAADAIKISRYDAGDETFTGEQLSAADVTGDGIVDAADAIKVGRYDAGLITEL